MHRNTYLVVSILAVLAALIVGVNVGKKLSPASSQTAPTPAEQSPQNTASPTPTQAVQTYVNTACGFSIQYTNEFSLMENASGSAILNNAADTNKSIVMTCQKDIPRPALAAGDIDSLYLRTTSGASVSAKLYHDKTAKDGAPVNALIFTHPTSKRDVFIAGYGDAFDALLKTLQIIP